MLVHLVARPDNLGIDEAQRLGLGVLCGAVGNEDAAGDANLNRRETDAGGVVHGLQHVVHERAHVVIDLRDRFGHAAKHWVGQCQNRP